MTSPFDDPDFRAQLEAMGVTHKPGMAKELLGQIAPLLADEGIDLDDLDANDLDSVNAALARATERHNLALFTPVGAHLTGAYALLRQFTLAIAEENIELAEALLGGIPVDPEPNVPAISHVIGVSLGLLDERQTDATLRHVQARMRVPVWRSKPSKTASRDVTALAAKGRAFEALPDLHRRHSGLAIFEGGALSVAASVIAQAKVEQVPVEDVVSRVLVSDATSGAASGGGAAFGSAATGAAFGLTPKPEADAVAHEFRAWLQQESQIAAPHVAAEMQIFELLQDVAADEELDLAEPDDIDPLIDALLDVAEQAPDDAQAQQTTEYLLDVLDDYLHFRLDTAADPEIWDDAHGSLEEVRADGVPMLETLHELAQAAETIDPEERRRALADVTIVRGVRELLSWVGSGRPVTSSGGLRRSDIEPVAAMMGLSAVGVAKRPSRAERDDDRIYAQSMWDIAALSSWWSALSTTDLLQISATRVYAGANAEGWSAASVPPLAAAEMLVGVFVADVVAGSAYGLDDDGIETETIHRVVRALAPEGAASDADMPATLRTPLALLRISALKDAGLVERDAQGAFTVPEPLRAAVARGVMLAVLAPMMAEMQGEE